MSVSAVIVNYNAGPALLASIGALLDYPGQLAVCVVDNQSTDDSLAQLQQAFGADPRLTIIRNQENAGFARGVNQVALQSAADYVLVLNPDCVLEPGALEQLVGALQADAQAAVAGPWVCDSDGTVQSGTWRRFPDPWSSLMTFSGLHRLSARAPSLEGVNAPQSEPPPDVIRVEAVSGACMLVRREAGAAVGFMDEGYGMHCEDLDLMYRLQQGGYHCLLVPQARATHAGGISSSSRPFWVHRQKHLGMQRYFRKFQAKDLAFPARWIVNAGIWVHYLLTLPAVLVRKFARKA